MKQLRKLHLLSEKYHRILGSVAEKLNAQMGLGRKKNGQPFVLCTTKLYSYSGVTQCLKNWGGNTKNEGGLGAGGQNTQNDPFLKFCG